MYFSRAGATIRTSFIDCMDFAPEVAIGTSAAAVEAPSEKERRAAIVAARSLIPDSIHFPYCSSVTGSIQSSASRRSLPYLIGSIVTLTEPGTLSASTPESTLPMAMMPGEGIDDLS